MQWNRDVAGTISRSWAAVMSAVLKPGTTTDEDAGAITKIAAEAAPVVWMLGKVQSGKTSIVSALTQSPGAVVGEGFKPCTRTASIFDFPAEAPVIRFLDTRGLGEAGYDAAEDIGVHEKNAHLIIAVMKAADPQQDAVVKAVAQARRAHPEWPVIVAQTTLHEAYPPGVNHPSRYPFVEDGQLATSVDAGSLDLNRSLRYQRSLFEKAGGTGPILFVPLDFTKDGDGFEPRHYGLEALIAALEKAAPASVVASVARATNASRDKLADSAQPHILGYAAAAAAADAFPAAGAVAVPAIQSKMLHSLGRIYGVAWDRQTLVEFGGCLGAGVLSRLAASFGVRQLAKFIPVYGQTAGAAAASGMSFATTFAIGRAACLFLASHKEKGAPDPAFIAAEYKAALADAFTIFRRGSYPAKVSA